MQQNGGVVPLVANDYSGQGRCGQSRPTGSATTQGGGGKHWNLMQTKKNGATRIPFKSTHAPFVTFRHKKKKREKRGGGNKNAAVHCHKEGKKGAQFLNILYLGPRNSAG